MGKHYHHLSTTDRVTLMFLKRQGLSLRAIASELNRSPSILNRELQQRRLKADPKMPKQHGSQRVQHVFTAGPGASWLRALTSMRWSSTCYETGGLLSKSAAHLEPYRPPFVVRAASWLSLRNPSQVWGSLPQSAGY
jgi:hypothetical protein